MYYCNGRAKKTLSQVDFANLSETLDRVTKLTETTTKLDSTTISNTLIGQKRLFNSVTYDTVQL